MGLRLLIFATVVGSLVALAAVATACGGGEELSLEEYFQRLDSNIEDVDERTDAIEDPGAIDDPEATLDQKKDGVKEFFTAFLAIITDATGQLEGLEPPAAAQDAHDNFLAVVKGFQQSGEDAADKVDAIQSESEIEAVIGEFFSGGEGFEDACLALQEIADANNIAVDLGCVDEESAAPGLVEVEGRQLFMSCLGKGGPTVVMESGGAGHSATWQFVQPEVAEFTRVCVYDRAGTGLSSLVPPHGTIQAIAEDLHSLLAAAGVQPPYVLVGHSLGGIIVRQFASQYLDEIVGMVMVDTSGVDPRDRIQAALTPEEWQRYGAASHAADFLFPEGADLLGPDLGDIPLVVLSAGIVGSDVPPDLAEKVQNVRLEMHRELLGLSTNSIHVIAEDSDHAIPSNQPDLITDAIRQVVEAVRGR